MSEDEETIYCIDNDNKKHDQDSRIKMQENNGKCFFFEKFIAACFKLLCDSDFSLVKYAVQFLSQSRQEVRF